MSDTDMFEDFPGVVESPEAEATETPEADGTEATEADGTEATESEWPKIVEEVPEGALTVAQFLEHLNATLVGEEAQRLLDSGMPTMQAVLKSIKVQVAYASVTQAVNAKRDPLPHYIVRTTKLVEVLGEDGNKTPQEQVAERTYIPADLGVEAWRNRKRRGPGRPSGDEDTVQARLERAGKLAVERDKANSRLEVLQEKIRKMDARYEKYEAILARDGKTWEDANAAYAAKVSAEEASKTIADDEGNENSTEGTETE